MTEKAKDLGNEYVTAPERYECGLTKRELFAALYMANSTGSNAKANAHFAVEYADALLEELSKD